MNPRIVDMTKLNEALAEEEMERFIRGDDNIKPSPMHNLYKQREVATERTKRYMRWIKMCDELLGEGMQQLCVPPDYDAIAIAVVRAYPSSNLDHQMVLAMRQSKGTASPSVMRAALEHHRTTSARDE